MLCYTGAWQGPGGTSAKRMTSLYILRRSRSLQLIIPSQSSAASISHKSMLGQAGPCRALSVLLPSSPCRLPNGPSLSYGRPHAYSLNTLWWTSFFFSLPSFKSSAQNFLHDLISGPPMMCQYLPFLPVPQYLLPSFGCHLQSGQEFPVAQGHLGWPSASPGYVASHHTLLKSCRPFTLGLSLFAFRKDRANNLSLVCKLS